ncbi:hypothetical protein L7F22_005578 [Adiantum nelumboides]|nr:hypothetical protein [Adiantum nelumboides]
MASRRGNMGNEETKIEREQQYQNEETDLDPGRRDTEATLLDASVRYHGRRVTESDTDTGTGTDESNHSRWRMNTGQGKKRDDSDMHIQAFEQYAELKHIPEEEWEEYFPHILKKAARNWYYHYPTSKLQSYRKLKKAFILEYTDDRGDEDILCELDRIKQSKLSVKKYVQKIKELTRRLNESSSEKRMRAWFLSGFNSKKLREQVVLAPTKKSIELVHSALKLEQQAKKEKHRQKASSSYYSTNES